MRKLLIIFLIFSWCQCVDIVKMIKIVDRRITKHFGHPNPESVPAMFKDLYLYVCVFDKFMRIYTKGSLVTNISMVELYNYRGPKFLRDPFNMRHLRNYYVLSRKEYVLLQKFIDNVKLMWNCFLRTNLTALVPDNVAAWKNKAVSDESQSKD